MAKEFQRYFSGGLFETQNEVIPTKYAHLSAATGSSNTSLVAAVTGKKIRVLHISCSATTTETPIAFKDGSGGTELHRIIAPDRALNPPNADRFAGPFGLFETTAGTALVVDVGSGSDVQVNIVYIEV